MFPTRVFAALAIAAVSTLAWATDGTHSLEVTQQRDYPAAQAARDARALRHGAGLWDRAEAASGEEIPWLNRESIAGSKSPGADGGGGAPLSGAPVCDYALAETGRKLVSSIMTAHVMVILLKKTLGPRLFMRFETMSASNDRAPTSASSLGRSMGRSVTASSWAPCALVVGQCPVGAGRRRRRPRRGPSSGRRPAGRA